MTSTMVTEEAQEALSIQTAKRLSQASGREKKIPMLELFGPVLQGEGFLAGVQCHFIRVAGCDSHCVACDSAFTWKPDLLKQEDVNLMSAAEIREVLGGLNGGIPPHFLTLSGGNPCLYNFNHLIDIMPHTTFALETQGTRWQDWVNRIDYVVVSPKPRSWNSGTADPSDVSGFEWFLEQLEPARRAFRTSVKIVVGSEEDLEDAVQYARIASVFNVGDFSISILTLPSDSNETIIARWTKITDLVFEKHPFMSRVFPTFRILPQLHVLMHGHVRGV